MKINDSGQVALEFTTAFICLILFLVATTQIFVWFGSTIVNRHKAYEQTRIYAGNPASWSEFDNIDFYTPTPLNIFKDWKELK